MGSLTSCGKKAGAAWSPESRRIVLARAAELKRGGASAQDAARMAINERMSTVREMLRDAMKAPAPAPAPIHAAAPVAEPAPAPAAAQEAAAEPRRVEPVAEQKAEAPAAQPAQEAVAPSQEPAAPEPMPEVAAQPAPFLSALPLPERWDALVEQTKADGGDPDKGQRSYRAFTKLVGAIGESPMDVWNRWGTALGSTDLVNRTGPEVLAWMESNLTTQLGGYIHSLPGNQAASTATGAADYWRRQLEEWERRQESHDRYTDGLEKQARDVEELGGSAERIVAARKEVAAVNRAYAQNGARLRDGLAAAEKREADEAAAAKAAEAAAYKPFDQKELSKKPTPASISQWFRASYKGEIAWSNGHIVDFVGVPHIPGYDQRLNSLRKDVAPEKLAIDRLLPESDLQKASDVTPIGWYDRPVGPAKNGIVYLDRDGELMGADATYVRYFLSKYKGASFRAFNEHGIQVWHDGKMVGLLAPVRIADRGDDTETVASIKAKVAAAAVAQEGEAATAQAERAEAPAAADPAPAPAVAEAPAQPAAEKTEEAAPSAPAPAPQKKRTTAAERAAAERETARADYFAPGNIVRAYGGFDRVVSYQPPAGAGGEWSVTVRRVVKDGDGWVIDPKDNRTRTHATQPDAKELKAGPVARPESATPFSRRADADALEAEARALQAISENDDLFALPKSEKTTLEGIAADNDPGIKVVKNSTVGNQTFYTLTLPSGKTARLTVRDGNPYGPSLYGFDLVDGEMTNQITERPGENADYVSPRTGDVWIDVSLLTQRGEGRLVYNIAATLAHNTDRVFIGDPAGLSDEAMRRRPEQMLSSALKFGTTDHLAPHPRQVSGDAKIGVPPLRWVYGDDLANIRALIDLNLAAIDNAFPSAKNLGYDIATGQFVNAATGRPVDDRRLADRMGAGRGRGIAQAALAGSRTVKRAAVFRALLREEGGSRGGQGRRNGLLARLAGQRSSLAYADPDQRIFYSRSAVAPEVTARVGAVTELAERIAARWARAPEIVVVADMNDPAVPQAVRDVDEAQRSQGASGEPEGFFFDGKVYLLASQLPNDSATVRVLFHDALGHYGLRGTFGAELGDILDNMARLNARAVRAKAASYGLDFDKLDERRMAAEEVLAGMAQTAPTLGWVKRAIAAVRGFLRRVVPGFSRMTFSDDEIIANFILPARAFVERGGPGGPGGGMPAFSKAQSPDSEAFKRWFGDSKVVDAEGKPLVVYHGTGSDIESFSKDKSRDVGFHFGDVVAANYVMERERMKDPGARPNALPVYLSIRNPLRVADTNFSPFQFPAALARQVGDGSGISANELRDLADSLDALRGKPDAMRRAARQVMDFLESKGYDGLQYQNKKEGRGVSWAAFRPEQIKSATGNSGAFDPADPRIAFSRSAAEVLRGVDQKAIRNAFLDAVTSHGSVNLWERTVGTQYALAKKHPDTYGRVFDAVQDYLKDASAFANTAADAAPSLLPKLERMADLWKDGILRHGADPKDVERASAAIFEGTLEDTIFADDELRTRFGLTDGQIGLYREFRAAVDRSLTDMAKTEMVRIAGKEGERVAQATMAAETVGDAARIMREHLEALAEAQKRPALLQRADEIDGKADAVRGLMDRGYAPLMRFGRHTVTATDQQGEVLFFSMHESTREANAAARELGEDPAFAGATITQGVMSQEGFRLFNGLSLDSLELFAEATGNADNEVVQAYLKLATSTRSALRRMIHRKGTAGYSSNATRVLATFVTSNARLAAGNLHLGDARKAADAIPKEQGDLKDQAVKLVDYVTNPQEEAAAARGLLFTTFIGGSVASALVNLTQPLTMTLPWLSQFGGAVKASRRLLAAAATMATGGPTGELAKALARAEHEGIVSPQEIHHLQAEAMGALGNSPMLKKAAYLWGAAFSLSEQFNRRVSFIAAYQTAVEQGIDDPFMFAEQTVNETQGLYCVDEDTECLTVAGWKRHDVMRDGEPVYAIDAQGRLVESRLLNVHRFHGDIRATEFKNSNGFSMVVTDQHDMLVRSHNSRTNTFGAIRRVKPAQVKVGHHFLRVPLGDATARSAVYTDDEVRLFAWVSAEGSLFAHRNCVGKRGVAIVQSSSHNPQYVAEIDSLLERLGGHHNRYERATRSGGQMVRWRLRKALWRRVHDALPGKLIDHEFVARLTVAQMRIFIETFTKGDGHLPDEGGNVITQKSIQNLDALQAMAVLSGQTSTKYESMGRHDFGALYVAKNSKHAHARPMVRTAVHLPMAWCPETEHGTWIARRGGRTFVTGNSKANKANWARGAIGATLMTFKQFSVHYLEFLTRMWKSGPEGKKAVGVALAMLLLAAGADGLPFADDLNDVIDTIGQALGYDTNSKRWKRRFIAETLGLGDTAAEAATRGLTALPGMPIDLSLRMGLGNLLPATGLLLRSKTDASGDLLEIAGAAGGLAKKAMDGAGKALQGDVIGAGEAVAPLAIQNMLKGIRMGMTGDYRDAKGRKVMDVDAIDAGAKFLGFQPAAVARESSRIGESLRTVQLARNVESQIAGKWAQAAADGDSAGVQAARDELAAWNEKNPEARIRITPIQIRQRVAALRSNRADRTVKAAPKELRGLVAEGLK